MNGAIAPGAASDLPSRFAWHSRRHHKDVVREFSHTFPSGSESGGPSWLSLIGQQRLAVVFGLLMRIGDITNVLGFGGDGSIHGLLASSFTAVWMRSIVRIFIARFTRKHCELSEFGQ